MFVLYSTQTKNIHTMKAIDIIKVPVTNLDSSSQLCFKLRGVKYYMAYEKDIHTPKSVLFADLNWLRKHFSYKRTETSVITKKSLNEGRNNEINHYKLALKANCPLWELHKLNKKGDVKINPDTKEPYRIAQLTDYNVKRFQENIDMGLFVLCEIVEDYNECNNYEI